MLTAQIHYRYNNARTDSLHAVVRKGKLNPLHKTPSIDTANAGCKKRNRNL
jgi:hypothetical protein